MTDSKQSLYYHIYLLIIWEELIRDEDSETVIRIRLEDPGSGQQQGFASLEALADALRNELDKRQE